MGGKNEEWGRLIGNLYRSDNLTSIFPECEI